MEITGEDVVFDGEEKIGRGRLSDWAERGFCNAYGSNLFYPIPGSGDDQISVGLLEDQSRPQISSQVFTDSKPPFCEFSNTTKMMAAAAVIAAFAPPAE